MKVSFKSLYVLITVCLSASFQSISAQYQQFAPVADKLQKAAHSEFYNGQYYNHNNTGNAAWNYWWNSHGVDAYMDGFLRERSDWYKLRARTLLSGIKQTNGSKYPTTFYDDMAWLAIASLRGYEYTGDNEYLNAVNALWTDMKTGQQSSYGGAIQWNKSAPYSLNACTNGPAIILATRLYRLRGTNADLNIALNIYNWMKTALVNPNNGEVWDNFNSDTKITNKSWIFSYNQGTWIGANLELYKATGQQQYLDEAVKTANTAIKNHTGGILYPMAGGGDGGLFNGIFIRYLALLAREGNISQTLKNQYIAIIRSTAMGMKNHGINPKNNTVSSRWAVAPDDNTDYSNQLSGVMLAEAAASTDLCGLYPNDMYHGKMIYLKEGNYSNAQIVAKGISANSISSLSIPYGLSIVAFSADNFSGDSIVFATNQEKLEAWDNRIMSLRIIKSGTGEGLKAQYFEGNNFEVLKISGVDAKIDFDWGEGSVDESKLSPDNFSAKWNGLIEPRYSGKYVFIVSASDSAVLWINQTEIFNSAKTSGNVSDTIDLEAGLRYEISLNYKALTGTAACKLEWKSQQQTLEVVPASQLYVRAPYTLGLVTVYADCDYKGFYGGLYTGDYNSQDLNTLGILTNDIASVKVNEGFKAVFYDHDNFSGDSIIITTDSTCLRSWENRVKSAKVLTHGDTSLEGIYYLRNRATNFNMEVTGGYTNTNDAANIQMGPIRTTINQHFIFTHISNGLYLIRAEHSHKALEVASLNKFDGANVQQMATKGTDNQYFVAIRTDDGYHKFAALHSGKIIEAASTLSNANVRQLSNMNQTRGQWQLLAVDYPRGNGTGLNAEYYNGQNFNNFRFSRMDTTINYHWGNGAPDPRVNADNFSVRWTGKILPRFSDNYTFYINSDNGRRLWINNKLIIDKWLDDYDVEYSGSISLTANQLYEIKLEYFDSYGGASCKLEWFSASQGREIVPKSQLFEKNTDTDIQSVPHSVRIYPNPVVDKKMFVSIPDNINGDTQISIFDLSGRKLLETPITKTESINLQNFESGTYLVRISGSQLNIRQTVIVR
ncbi:MAG: T9SS type A sorting domain-containing protein [Paludibacteraceae bacterium]|nr:T9SS type A sorting domain-containing protein [Paludibacteraceae bacterium]